MRRKRETQGDGEHLWQRHKTKLYFDDADLDVHLLWTLLHGASRGAEIGEAIYAASQVKPRDPSSWALAWSELAERVEAEARSSLERGHRESARLGLLRAANYHRAAMTGIPLGEELWRRYELCVAAFRDAGALRFPAVEELVIPYKGWNLPGYFIPAPVQGPAPTLIVVPGGEMVPEDTYYWLADAASSRGWHLVAFDPPSYPAARYRNPGQGRVEPAELPASVSTLVDHLLERPDVDPERLAAIGFSGGGFVSLNTVSRERRIKALVADAPILDMHALASAELPAALRSAPNAVGNALVKLAGVANPFLRIQFEKFLWQFAVDGPAEWLRYVGILSNRDIVEDIACPVLCLTGEGESEEQRTQAAEAFRRLRVPKAMRVFTAREGAEGHCQVNNPSLMQAVAFDWLDETLPAR